MICFGHSRRIHRFLTAWLCAGLAACSVHPLPGDIPRVSTVDIVKAIRCEALAGIDSLRPEEKLRAEPVLKATVIGYDFTFDITETNDIGSSEKNPNLLTFANGKKTTLDLTASASLTRANKRTFTIIEPLADLTKPQNRDLCTNRTAGANWAYPITGTIGMDEIARTYLRLEVLTELQKVRAPPHDSGRAVDPDHLVFADDLQFTTHFDAGAGTTLVLDAVVGSLKLTKASISAAASRHDTHRVVVALMRKPIDVVEKATSKAGSAIRDRQRLLTSGNIRDPRTQASLLQVDQDARTAVAIELYRRRDLNDIDNAPAEALGQRLLDVLKVP
jgi:hypothetical protein